MGLSDFFSGIDWSAQGAKLMGTLVAGIKWAFMNLTPVGWLIQAFSGVKGFLEGIDLSQAGAKLMGTLAAGIKSTLSLPFDLVKSGLMKVRNLLPFSDAKEGPLSALTSSGQAIMNTLASGVQQAVPSLTDAVKGGAAIAAASMIIAAPPALASQGQSEVNSSPFASMAIPEPSQNIPGLNDQDPSVQAVENKTVTTKKSQKRMVNNTFNITLPGVSDAQGFMKELQKFMEEYDV
jgi:hypothetical protein